MNYDELPLEVKEILAERARTMQEFSADHRPLNLYAIYRQDLEMPPGKLSAQTGHAYQNALEEARKLSPDIEAQYKGTGNGTKICMYAKNLGQLMRAYTEAKAAGIPCSLVIDRGHKLPPFFDGSPIITALGIGPVYSEQAHPITKRYTLSK